MKDNFSLQSEKYAKFRPSYPIEIFDLLQSLVPDNKKAWDCGTGNGQVAFILSEYFETVYATDISSRQIENASQNPKIIYSVQEAEKALFDDNSLDLITVAQAIHWFAFEAFYTEVDRTLKTDGIIAVIGYGLVQTFKEADLLISKLYEILGPYWDKERKYIEAEYKTIPFPFSEMECPSFVNELEWTFEHMVNYLDTWSAVQHYKKKLGKNPIDIIYQELQNSWGYKEKRKVSFPIFLRIGRKV